jgi:hypothetical protein
MKLIGVLLLLAAACGGVDDLAEGESAARAVGCEGTAFAHCPVCNDLDECTLQTCGSSAWYFWSGAQNDDRIRCRDLVSRWAGPKVCGRSNVEAYTFWFRTSSGEERLFAQPRPCD